MGVNKALILNEQTQNGSVFELLKLTNNRIHSEPPLKLCMSTGRQISVRDLRTNKICFVPIKDRMDRITALTSNQYIDKSVFAAAFMEEQPDLVSLEVFSTDDPDKMTSITGRIKVSLPKFEEALPEIKKKDSVICEYHKTDSKVSNATPTLPAFDPPKSSIT